jgi:diacylglycerol O-acyltransferase / wax synthase
MTTSDESSGIPQADSLRPERFPSRGELVRDALEDRARQLKELPALLRRTAGNLRSVVRHRRGSDVSTPVPIISTPRTAFNTALTPQRSFATASLSLDEAREVKRAFGVTLNDVVLAVVSGSLRAYLEARGELPDRPLVAGVPVASDPAFDRMHGNRVSNMFTSLATDVVDPVERLRRIHDVTDEAKTLQRLIGMETFGDWVQYTPPGPYAWFMDQYSHRRVADRHPPPINLVVSNVPGPDEPLYAAGAPLREIYSVGPILEGIGLNITIWSYLDRLFVGALGCRPTVPDIHQITDGMTVALAELVRAAAERPVVASHA